MKKIFVIMLALFLAVPALSYAGSATSRWDMTIGGMINFDFAYFSKDGNTDSFWGAYPDSLAGRTSPYTDRGNFYFSAADSNVNFTVKGPDAWGAKTTAFLAINFRGTNTGNNFGGAQIQHAAVRLNWPTAELLMGKTFQQFGDIYGRAFIIASDMGIFWGGGTLPSQIAFRYWWTKNFNTMIGVTQATDWEGTPGGGGTPIRSNNDSYARSQLPQFQYEVAFETDACGKVGPNGLKFGLGGIVGKEYKTNTTITNAYTNDTVPVWSAILRGFVPIIPEKQGNKTNAFFFSGNAFIGQNWAGNNWMAPPGFYGQRPSIGSYWRPNGTDAASPTNYGGLLQLTYYFADNIFANAQYGYLKTNWSSWARGNGAGGVGALSTANNEYDFKGPNQTNATTMYGLSLFYDANPALRFGFEWMRLYTKYNGYAAGTATTNIGTGPNVFDTKGQADQYKVGVMYFF